MSGSIRIWQVLAILAALALVLGLAGCGGDNNEESNAQALNAFLSGRQVSPSTTSAATASVHVTLLNFTNTDVDESRDRQIRVVIDSVGLTGVTAVEMRLGAPGEEGPLLFSLWNTNTNTGTFPNRFTRVLRVRDFTPVDNITSFNQVRQALLDGRVYVLIRTTAFPEGEVRGQIGANQYVFDLTPASGVTGTSSAIVTLNPQGGTVRVRMFNNGVNNATGARLVLGEGANAPTLFVLRTQSSGAFGNEDITVNAGRLNRVPSEGIRNFNDFLAAVYAGRVFLRITGTNFPEGVFNGRVTGATSNLPTVVRVRMTNTAFIPAQVSARRGSIVRFVNESGNTLRITADDSEIGGPDSNDDLANGASFDFLVPTDAEVGRTFFFHEDTRGTAGDGTTIGTGMAGSVTVLSG